MTPGLARIAPLVAAAAIAWHLIQVIGPSWERVVGADTRGRDFASYYLATQVAWDGGDPYEHGGLSRGLGADGSAIISHPFLYPPPFLLLMTWSLPLELPAAYRTWFWLNELWLWVALLALWRWWRPLGPLVGVVLAVAVAVFTAVPGNLVMGQANFPGLALALLGLWATDRDRWVAGGALLGAACMVKMSPALFLGLWLLQGRWKPVLVACATAVALTIATLPLLDLQHQLVFYTRVLRTFGSGDYNGLIIDIDMFGNHGIPNLWHQLFPSEGNTLSLAAQLASTASAIALIGGLMYHFRTPTDAFGNAARAAAVGVALLMVPVYTYEHHCVWAIPAVVVSVVALLEGRLSPRWALPLGASVAAWAFEVLELKGVWLGVRSIPPLAFAIQEAKFVALVVFLAASAWLGGRYDAVSNRSDDVPAR